MAVSLLKLDKYGIISISRWDIFLKIFGDTSGMFEHQFKIILNFFYVWYPVSLLLPYWNLKPLILLPFGYRGQLLRPLVLLIQWFISVPASMLIFFSLGYTGPYLCHIWKCRQGNVFMESREHTSNVWPYYEIQAHKLEFKHVKYTYVMAYIYGRLGQIQYIRSKIFWDNSYQAQLSNVKL